MNYAFKPFRWESTIAEVLQQPSGKDLVVEKWWMIHPLRAGFTRSFGLPQGERFQYRLLLEDGRRSVHVREYDDVYRVHWDQVDPRVDLIEHGRRDAPGVYVVACGAVGWLVGGPGGALFASLVGAATLPRTQVATRKQGRDGRVFSWS